MKLRVPFLKKQPTVAVVRMSGAIGMPGRGTLNDATMAPVLEKAFRKGKPRAVALAINSPGGSPVQSSLIGARIRRLSDETETPVYAFVEDVAASGGYWLAAAADEIWADDNSVLGSIGVVSAGFGAHIFLARQGIERRVYTAGTSKSQLDPFSPENPADVARLKTLLGDVHDNFISYVKTRRAGRLDEQADLFNGEIWLAARAKELGLIDGIAHLTPKMKDIFGKDVKFRRYGAKRSLWSRFGSQIAQDAIAGIEERADYARFGL